MDLKQIRQMPEEDRKALTKRIYQSFVLKDNLGMIFINLVHARQHIEDPLTATLFGGSLSFHLMILRQRMAAGDFTELDLRNAVKTSLNETGAPSIVYDFMDDAVTNFVELGS